MDEAEAQDPAAFHLPRPRRGGLPFVILIFSQAPATGSGGGLPSLQQLARPNGLIVGVTGRRCCSASWRSASPPRRRRRVQPRHAPPAAGSQPRRVMLLVGKMLGVITFMLLAFLFAAVVAFVVAVVMAHARHASTTPGSPAPAWPTCSARSATSRSPSSATASSGSHRPASCARRSSRSSPGFAWMIAIENIIARIVPSTDEVAARHGAGNGRHRRQRGPELRHGLLVGAVYLASRSSPRSRSPSLART